MARGGSHDDEQGWPHVSKITLGNVVISGYSRSPKLLKGAFVQLGDGFLGPIPNIIIFQYNPETMTRSLSPWLPREREPTPNSKAEPENAQPFDPSETFQLTLQLDAADALEDPISNPVAMVSGIADRIAALEMLLYPPDENPVGQLVSAIGDTLGVGDGEEEKTPRRSVSVVLFVWGPGRIVPVRLTSFSVEEQMYSPRLYPIRAKVTVSLRVLTAESFTCSRSKEQTPKTAEEIAMWAYKFTRDQKAALAVANVANTTESILGLLPF